MTQLFTLPVILSFIGGVFAGQFVNWLQYRWRIRKDPTHVVKRSHWESVIAVLIVVVLVWIMYTTQQARNCALRLNNSISEEQRLSKIERDALQNLIFAAVQPPPDIAVLPQDDPRKKEWGQQLGAQYVAVVQDAARQRVANQAAQNEARQACGR